MTGQKFNRLTVMWPAGYHTKARFIMWLCQCDCGAFVAVSRGPLKNGNTKSCGCLNRELNQQRKSNLIHGKSGTAAHMTYMGAKARCTQPNHISYPDYGGRGIEFRFETFEEFFAELGPKPEPSNSYSIDRINNDGHYEVGNVRWATTKEQRDNQGTFRLRVGRKKRRRVFD